MLRTFSYLSFQDLYEAARMVLDQGKPAELLREPLQEIEEMVQFRESAEGKEVLTRARDRYTDTSCDIEIDDGSIVYHNETDGHWVLAWCFLPDSEDEDDMDDDCDDESDLEEENCHIIDDEQPPSSTD
jgi:hypothetical protein